MSTGILSVAAAQRSWQVTSLVLLVVAGIGYAGLVILNMWRIIAYREAFLHDLRDSRQAFLIFTFVAGTDVLAAALAEHGQIMAATILLAVGTVSWLLLGYTIPWAAVLSRAERPVTDAANGTWFIWVVAAQSVATVTATLEQHYEGARHGLSVLAVVAWSVGVVLYVAVAMLVIQRILQAPLDPHDFDPPYWVSMGAIAISIVAGSRIVEMQSAPMVDAVRGLIAGGAVVMWAFATWLIPALIAVGVWRHFVKRVPLEYTPTLWSLVFPLGMYSVAGMYLGRADLLPLVEWIGQMWIWVALAAWAATGTAMVRSWFLAPASVARG